MSFSSAIGRFDTGFSPIQGSTGPPPGTSTAQVLADINRVYDNVQAVLPAVTLPLIEMALWNTIEEFSIRGTYFRAHVNWQMPIGVSSLDFNPFSSAMVVTWVIEQEGLLHYEIIPPAKMVDLYQPNAARNGHATLVLKPASFAVVTQGHFTEMFSTWFETMLDGTLFRLYGQPAKPWSSPQLAEYHGRRFRQGMNRARDIAERLHSPQQAPARIYPYFASGRRKN
jgi:hypothetical protein